MFFKTGMSMAIAGCLICGLAASRCFSEPAKAPATGETRVCRWAGDRKAALLLMFDDCAPTQLKNVLPEMKKRNLVATFYVNPAKPHWKAFKAAWESDAATPGSELANHTMSHKPVKDVEEARQEIKQCSEIIRKMEFPDATEPKLLSYGQPGVGKGNWKATPDEMESLLAEDKLVQRPTFPARLASIHVKDAAAILARVDKAVAEGGIDGFVFHGVGGDWFPFPLAEFITLIDALAARQNEVWVTTHMAAHKYETERESSTASVISSDARSIRLSLTSKADPSLYDTALTLITGVPADWRRCRVTQGQTKIDVNVVDGQVQYDAVPGNDVIQIEPTGEAQ